MNDEQAKALQEVAKTAHSAVEAARDAGGFLGDLFREPLREGVGMLTDTLRVKRWERALRLRQRVLDRLNENPDAVLRDIPMSVGVPLLQAASLVEEQGLADRWAEMLVNFARADSGVFMQRAFVSALEDMSPLDVTIMDVIYSLQPDLGANTAVRTGQLPDRAEWEPESLEPVSNPDPANPSEEVQLSLANLVRLGCLRTGTFWGGGEVMHSVYRSKFGRELVAACTPR